MYNDAFVDVLSVLYLCTFMCSCMESGNLFCFKTWLRFVCRITHETCFSLNQSYECLVGS